MRMALWLLAPVLLASPVAGVSRELTFHGLNGYSTRAEVIKEFSGARSKNTCRHGEVNVRNADGEHACSELEVPSYVLDNTRFRLSFIFNPDGTLRFISLYHGFNNFGPDDPAVAKTEIESRFRSLVDMLSTKYGPAVRENPGMSFALKSEVGSLEWQPGRGERWVAGGDRIMLSANAYEIKGVPGTYTGSLHLFYTFGKVAQLHRF